MDTIGEILAGLQGRGAFGRARVEALVEEAWGEIAGEDSPHTRPGRIRGRTLFVLVDCSARAHMLAAAGKERILARAAQVVGDGRISDVVFRVGLGGSASDS